MYRLIDTSAAWIARAIALLGGFVLIAVIIMTCLSIIGRTGTAIGLGPVPGDFELVELGVGFAIFCFMPWAQYARAHARVDLFTPAFSGWQNRLMDVVADLGLLVSAFIIAKQLRLGMLDKIQYFETSFILHMPLWWGYAAAMLGAVAWVLVAAFCLMRSSLDLAKGGEAYEQL
ncbi:TRAP transporter small permease [Mesobacterium pallidum]|uniref:TRAP transporter small permease n=1 Tax=Mesobacterium pallidum TaxID=2872037 RepID=UPI001EE25BFC|nr:TRAP transporter small permease [Mesobacterium pallidum]